LPPKTYAIELQGVLMRRPWVLGGIPILVNAADVKVFVDFSD